MSNEVWSDLDIDNRVTLLIRSKVSESDELKAARLFRSGGQQDFVSYVDNWIKWCVDQGRQAKLDSILLEQVLNLEKAYSRLNQPVILEELDADGNIINKNEVDLDVQQRSIAEKIISSSSTEAKELYKKRNPEQI